MKKILGYEALVFFCSVMFGTVVLPAFTFVILSFFGLMPRNSSLADCYNALKALLGPHQWIFWIGVFGPVVVVEAIRFIRWRQRGGPWYVEPIPDRYGPGVSASGGTYCEFSMMTWRDGVDELHEPDRKDENG